MDPMDREVLALRHFEQLDNNETAEALAITPTCASSRYLRALKRLKEVLGQMPGIFPG
jgi:RNA polymerase sigma-70 factor (ECF subfamily)